MRVLVIGADGMLGHAVLRYFSTLPHREVVGSVRSSKSAEKLRGGRLLLSGDLLAPNALETLVESARPAAVINCAAVTKLVKEGSDPALAIAANSLMPHRLYSVCHERGARLVQISTDCVFDGERGGYAEHDQPNATDLYGKTKALGEVVDKPDAVTVRTSLIGREIASKRGLLEWFLSQDGQCKGYSNAFFSGVTTTLMAQIIDRYLLDPGLSGLYHVAGPRIDKFHLLEKAGRRFGKTTEILPDEQLKIDRSLNGDRFAARTGFVAPSWDEMLAAL